MTLGYIVTLRNDRLDLFIDALGPDGLLRIYDGVQPATGGTATTLLAELALSTIAAPAASSGMVTFGPIAPTVGVANGTPTWGRFCTSGGSAVADCTAGVADPSKDLDFSDDITVGIDISCTSLTVLDGSS